jgi:hypothetical protein
LADINLVALRTYLFQMMVSIARAAGTTSHTVALSFGGTATFTIDYSVIGLSAPSTAMAATTQGRAASAAAYAVTPANASAAEEVMLIVRGVIRTTVAGTLIPQVTYSAAPGGTPIFARNNHIRLDSIGVNTVHSVN